MQGSWKMASSSSGGSSRNKSCTRRGQPASSSRSNSSRSVCLQQKRWFSMTTGRHYNLAKRVQHQHVSSNSRSVSQSRRQAAARRQQLARWQQGAKQQSNCIPPGRRRKVSRQSSVHSLLERKWSLVMTDGSAPWLVMGTGSDKAVLDLWAV